MGFWGSYGIFDHRTIGTIFSSEGFFDHRTIGAIWAFGVLMGFLTIEP